MRWSDGEHADQRGRGIGKVGERERQVPPAQLPTVIFVWGPGRIVPVRVGALSITERRRGCVRLGATE